MLVLILAVGQPVIELAVGVFDGLLEQAVLGLEVVENGRRARPGSLGDVADAGIEQAPLIEDLGGSGHDLRFAQMIDSWSGAHLSSAWFSRT